MRLNKFIEIIEKSEERRDSESCEDSLKETIAQIKKEMSFF